MTRLPYLLYEPDGPARFAYWRRRAPKRRTENDPIRTRRISHQSLLIKRFWLGLRRRGD